MATASNPEQPRPSAPFTVLAEELRHPLLPPQIAISQTTRMDEQAAVEQLLRLARPAHASDAPIRALAHQLVQAVRARRCHAAGVDALMHEFSLSSEEGVALMCLAEALLRIPDAATADRLIADKVARGNWLRHLGQSRSLFVNATAWSLLITGKLVAGRNEQGLAAALARLLTKGGEAFIRKGMDIAMRMLGRQFVLGETIEQALASSRELERRGYRYSYDMLGEAALTAQDAAAYYSAYESALHAIGKASAGRGIHNGPGISVKLSALHPRYSRAQRTRVLQELLPRLKQLLLLAKQYDIGLNIDAEEADRLELSLELIEALVSDPALVGYEGLGIVVQAYQKRCPLVIDYLADLARRNQRRLMVRLVKGAYWDAEIKRAQVEGLSGYPVYTRKAYTDLSYLVCAQKLLDAADCIYPQFATHNAHTLATVYHWAQQRGVEKYEFQCLHGMGESLYDQVVGPDKLNRPCRIYAPVGSHQTLLAYLVRRLLENGANTSFVNQIVDEQIPIDALLADPFGAARALGGLPHPAIPLPAALFGAERRNSAGIDLSNESSLHQLNEELQHKGNGYWRAEPLTASIRDGGPAQPICNPADRRDQVGQVSEAGTDDIETALAAAHDFFAGPWQQWPVQQRSRVLLRAADLFEKNSPELIALAVREAGKTLPNAVAEVREAVDFLRYYAAHARAIGNIPALGPVACISPWNFPLAIFTGQISAALAAGNVVLAKPAEQTPLIAYRAVQLLQQAGIPRAALQFLPGSGEVVGARLVADPRVRGVMFTGSTEVAQLITRTLARRAAEEGEEIALIAETGGQNAMIVDSSALPEQVVQDVLASSFDSAGQRCSALRVLCLQQEVADRILHMLIAALHELRIGHPARLSCDIGPVIDAQAQQGLLTHIEHFRKTRRLHQLPLSSVHQHGHFVAPAIIEIDSISELTREVFGPVLHVVRYRRDQLPQLIEQINATGYGLTLGIHSRIDETVDFIVSRARVGNVYVNRNMIGAAVGVQPFGGEGKSGTGPKAGGPLYLWRLLRKAPALPAWQSAVARKQSTEGLAPLQALLQWLRNEDYAVLAGLAEHYQQSTLLPTMLQLPGPTGESNSLHFTPRGRVLCIAASIEGFLHQLAAALATGNRVAVPRQNAGLIPAGLPALVCEQIDVGDWPDGSAAAIDCALLEKGCPREWHLLLADRDGPLVPVIGTSAIHPLPLWRLVTERAVCINTSAAGGNASLMTLQE